ncbi:hypothetical protein BH23CHL5_BH23CHL5_13590 [soil metagenome]
MLSLLKRGSLLAIAVALMVGVIGLHQATRAAAQDAAFAVGAEVVVFDGALNLRESPGLDAEVIEVLADATALTVTGASQSADSLIWYPVSTTAAVEGWVTGEFITAAPVDGDFALEDAVTVSNGPLNMRESAGTDAAILDALDDGTAAVITGGPTTANDFVWYEIELAEGETGWVAAEFLALAESSADTFASGDSIVVSEGPLNLRGGASVNGTVLETLDEGTSATVVAGPSTADELDWYQIELADGVNGWVAGSFLALVDTAPEEQDLGDISFPIGSFVFVNAEQLNLRADASTESEIVQTANDGEVASVLDGPVVADGFTWFQVSLGSGETAVEGWFAGELLSGGIVLGIDAVVVEGPLNLRESASADAESIAQLDAGDIVNVVAGPSTGGGVYWFEVTAGVENGFVAGRYLGPQVEE